MFIMHYNDTGMPAGYCLGCNFSVMPPSLEKQRITCEIRRGRFPIVYLQLQ